MMNISFDHQIFSWQKYGGISRYYIEIAEHLSAEKEINLKIISPIYVNEYLANSKVNIDGIKVPQLKRSGRFYREINRWITPYRMNKFKPDVVHETYYSSKTVAPKGAKVVVTVHDMIHEIYKKDFSLLDKTSEEKRKSVNRADHIICVSENTRKDLINLFDIDPDKTSVIYHGFELKGEPSALSYFDFPYILYVGSRSGYKNFYSFLLAYSLNKDIYQNFKIVAFGGGEFSKNELAKIEKISQGKWNVQQIEGDDEILATLYKFAVAFVYPSLYEGFGIPPLEAMSCGCPVLCSNVSSLPEVVGNAAELFDPSSIDSLSDALNKVVFNEEYKSDLIIKGYKQCEFFSWSRSASDTLDVYKKLR